MAIATLYEPAQEKTVLAARVVVGIVERKFALPSLTWSRIHKQVSVPDNLEIEALFQTQSSWSRLLVGMRPFIYKFLEHLSTFRNFPNWLPGCQERSRALVHGM